MRQKIMKHFPVVASMILVTILIISANWLNKRHLTTVKNQTSFAYEELLRIQSSIIKLNYLTKLEMHRLEGNDLSFETFLDGESIDTLIKEVAKNTYTGSERPQMNALSKTYANLIEIGKSGPASDDISVQKTRSEMHLILGNLQENLNRIENTMHKENTAFPNLQTKSLHTSEVLLDVEIAFLLIIGILFQVIILYPIRSENIL